MRGNIDGRIPEYDLPGCRLRFRYRVTGRERSGDSRSCGNGTRPLYIRVLQDVSDRDARDAGRKDAPMMQAENAIMIDTSSMTPEKPSLALGVIEGRADRMTRRMRICGIRGMPSLGPMSGLTNGG